MINNNETEDEYKERMIRQFSREGGRCMIGLGFWVDKELAELKEKMMKKEAEKGKKVVDVIASNDESSPATARKQSGFSPSWDPHITVPTKKRTTFLEHVQNERMAAMNYKMVQEQRTKKRTIKIEEEHRLQKAAKKIKKTKSTPLPPPRPMPIDLQQTITKLGCATNPTWLTAKELTPSDMNPQQSRLFLTKSCDAALEAFMTAEEKDEVVVSEDSKTKNKGLNVMVVIGTRGEQIELDFKYWESVGQYVLTSRNWNTIVATFGMNVKDVVEVWCFRQPAEKGSKLCFAINIVRTPTAE